MSCYHDDYQSPKLWGPTLFIWKCRKSLELFGQALTQLYLRYASHISICFSKSRINEVWRFRKLQLETDFGGSAVNGGKPNTECAKESSMTIICTGCSAIHTIRLSFNYEYSHSYCKRNEVDQYFVLIFMKIIQQRINTSIFN
ncbi:Hypothetical_protein [Hexamita inflata]|uniref:Hypothetical_protein n=1 Tax=Hexamita inflata TaxID=28002 RepID=A0AA86QL43_9EUKA|nr:Hypothetical protein HINF_LOCUS42774 [Hexamita inflata]